MARCIVECCRNNTRTVKNEPISASFFQLPKCELMLDSWFAKIGKVKLPSQIDDAKICSLHFTEDCFVPTGLAIVQTASRKRRRLLPTAVPTLNLKATPKDNTLIPLGTNDLDSDCNIIYQTIELSNTNVNINGIRKYGKKRQIFIDLEKSSASILSTPPSSTTPCGATECLTVSTPATSRSDYDPWLDPNYRRVCILPPDATAAFNDAIECTTSAKRSQRLSESLLTSAVNDSLQEEDQLGNSSVNRNKTRSEFVAKCLMTIDHNSEGTPPSKRKRRFCSENCQENENDIFECEKEEDHRTDRNESTKANLKSHRSLVQFHMKPKEKDVENSTSSEAECAKLKLKLIEKEREINELKENYENVLMELNTELGAVQKAMTYCTKDMREKFRTLLEPYFTYGQIRCILEERRWVKWSIEDYAAAISLHSVSPKAYTYLKDILNFPLPSSSLLRKWALKTFEIREGFLHDVLILMREKSKVMSPMERVVVITFDEMALSPEVYFDSKLEKLVAPFGKVQVIMARGLFSNWEQPIYYAFDQHMTKAIINTALTRLHEVGYEGVAMTCDMKNKKLFAKDELDITPTKHFFEHPSIKDGIVCVFADVPGLLKLLRDWFLDEGLYLGKCEEKFTKDVFQSLMDMSVQSNLRMTYRITERHLDSNQSTRQAERLAAQLWSRSSAIAIKWAGQKNLIRSINYQNFAAFVFVVNNWFDVHNSVGKYGTHQGVNGFGVDYRNQEKTLRLMSMYTENMRIGHEKNAKDLMPFQKGILISNASLKKLYKYLHIKYPQFQYLITRRLNQDVLKNFFAYLRAMGKTKDNPSGWEFRYRLRCYIMGKHSHAIFIMNRNTEENVNSTCITSIPSVSPSPTAASTSAVWLTPLPESSTSKNDATGLPGVQIYAAALTDCAVIKSEVSTEKNEEFNAQNDGSYANLNSDWECQGPSDEIILTEELFVSVTNVSPEELETDSARGQALEDSFKPINYDDEEEEDELLSAMQFIQSEKYPSDIPNCASDMNVVREAGVEYVTGYIAHRFRFKYKHLGQPTCSITELTNEAPSWVQILSKGHLIKPSQQLLDLGKIAEECFINFHGNYFSKEDQVIRKVIKLIKNTRYYNPRIPDEVLQCLVRTRTYIRVREINKMLYIHKKR